MYAKCKERETMTSRERVAAFFAGKETDRVPINAFWNPGVAKRVAEHLGAEGGPALQRALGVDFRGTGVAYNGPALYEEVADRRVDPVMGFRTRWVEHGAGGYWDYCDFPLAKAGKDEVAAWPIADPEHFNYDAVRELCKNAGDQALFAGGAGLGCIINTAGFVRGMEQALIDVFTGDEAGMLLVDKFLDLQYERTRRILEAGDGRIDFMWMGEDLGTQIGPLIDRDTLRKNILPRHKRFLDLAREYKLPTLMHTCGSSSWAYDDYIELGLTGVDTLQPEAKDMSPEYLKKTFRGKLVFHGCISTAGVLSSGTVDEVRKECRSILETMMPGGGYAFSPTHCMQDNTPTENVIAMYETVHEHGWYA